jgi:hypothetical protein
MVAVKSFADFIDLVPICYAANPTDDAASKLWARFRLESALVPVQGEKSGSKPRRRTGRACPAAAR